MFEAATASGAARRAARRVGWVVASLAAQAALLAAFVALPPRRAPRPPDGPVVEVKLVRAAPLPALPALRGAPRAPPPPRVKPPPARRELERRPAVARAVQPKELPAAAPAPAAAPEPDPEPAADDEGVVGGVAGAGRDAPAGPPQRDARVEFDDTMTRPMFVSGPKLEYPLEALQHAVAGEMVVKCVITVDGRVYDCRVLRSLPYMERTVVAALEQRRYRPAERGGRPLEVAYTFRIKLSAN